MSVKAPSAEGQVLCWPKRLLSAEDLRRHLNGQRELMLMPGAIVTPLALDELKSKGVALTWQLTPMAKSERADGAWCYVQERPDAAVVAALTGLLSDGIRVSKIDWSGASPWQSACEIGNRIQAGRSIGGLIFTADATVVCCVANKIAGVRAAAVLSSQQAARARQNLGANLFAVEIPGRTIYEIRSIVKAAVQAGQCPAELAAKLRELDGHAHR